MTTVGYGDVTPQTFNEKVIAIIMIIVGIFVFSTITAAISSYLTDRLIKKEDDELRAKLDSIKEDMDKLHHENEELKRDINDLKELLKDD